jgi:hypothetical protein
MRSNLRHGRLLCAPGSIIAARATISQLQYECQKIRKQLDDPSRLQHPAYKTIDEYERWQKSARNALLGFEEEIKLITAWIESKSADVVAVLLKRAYAHFKILREEDALEDDELAFVAELDEHFGAEKKAQVG